MARMRFSRPARDVTTEPRESCAARLDGDHPLVPPGVRDPAAGHTPELS
jgi:hypothetical protein